VLIYLASLKYFKILIHWVQRFCVTERKNDFAHIRLSRICLPVLGLGYLAMV